MLAQSCKFEVNCCFIGLTHSAAWNHGSFGALFVTKVNLVEEFYGTRYQSGSFSLFNVGSDFHCLHSFFFFLASMCSYTATKCTKEITPNSVCSVSVVACLALQLGQLVELNT